MSRTSIALIAASSAAAKNIPFVAIDARNPNNPCMKRVGRSIVYAIPESRSAASTAPW
jgi:hypothetical protein